MAFYEHMNDQSPKIFWRLYYDKATGQGLFMSMEDLPGDWIDVTREEYESIRLAYYLIRDGKLVEKDNSVKHRLRPGRPEVYTVHSEEHSLPVTDGISITRKL